MKIIKYLLICFLLFISCHKDKIKHGYSADICYNFYDEEICYKIVDMDTVSYKSNDYLFLFEFCDICKFEITRRGLVYHEGKMIGKIRPKFNIRKWEWEYYFENKYELIDNIKMNNLKVGLNFKSTKYKKHDTFINDGYIWELLDWKKVCRDKLYDIDLYRWYVKIYNNGIVCFGWTDDMWLDKMYKINIPDKKDQQKQGNSG